MSNLPEVELPGGSRTITESGTELGNLIAGRHTHYLRGSVVTRVVNDGDSTTLKPVHPAQLASDFELVAHLVTGTKKGPVPTTCSQGTANLILESEAFRNALPKLTLLSQCPLLLERSDGELAVVAAYDVLSGVLARGKAPDDMTIEEARELLWEVLKDFRFPTESDRSRALAAMITPMLVLSGLLPGRAPIDLGEADSSQTGKGYRNKITAAIYNEKVLAVTQRRSQIGSLEESFNSALIAGKTFIALDNIRSRVDSPAIESFCREDTYSARGPYTKNIEIDPSRVVLMFTSNSADITDDLGKRSSCVRILKQRAGYAFQQFEEGDLLDHVRTNQNLYLGAIFAVIREWHHQGKQRTNETRHDFREWAQTLDWIVQNLLGAAPLLDGHQEAQARMTNPALNWLREVALEVVRQERLNQWLTASDLIEVLETDGTIDIPGRDGGDITDDEIRKKVLQNIGRKLGRAFKSGETITLDHLRIDREEFQDATSNWRKHYRVTLVGSESVAVGPESLPTAMPVAA